MDVRSHAWGQGRKSAAEDRLYCFGLVAFTDSLLTPYEADGTLKVHPKFFKSLSGSWRLRSVMPCWRFGAKIFAHTTNRR